LEGGLAMEELTSSRRPDTDLAAIASFDGTVRKAFSAQSTLIGESEHCSLDPERLASIALVPGSQLRVRRSEEEFALYTVSETRQESDDGTVRMALAARERLDATEEFDATIEGFAPHPTYSDEEARMFSEFVERLDDNGSQRRLVVLAPHGGAIERFTDSQAERVGTMLGSDQASVWRCKGFRKDGGAFERWHITSTAIHEASFPLLRTLVPRGFAHAVAFHGFSEADVLVGGGAPLTLKQEIAAAIEDVLAGSGIFVRIADPSENYNGDSPDNLVNWLTACGEHGVQIEQSIDARSGFWEPIADAVASVYRKRLARSRRARQRLLD
jgi:phage replication-related protein YjqB (UPF0714/DUF867 family)